MLEMLKAWVLLSLLIAVSSFSKFVTMDDADACKTENNFFLPTNGDDEVYIKAWHLPGLLGKKPLEGGCVMSFMSYGNYGISYSFLGNASDNYINSYGVRLNIYNNFIAYGEPAVVYRAGDKFPNTTQHLSDSITVQLVNNGDTAFDFSIYIGSTDPPFEDAFSTDLFGGNFITIGIPIGASILGAICIGAVIFFIYKRKKVPAAPQMLRMDEGPTSFAASFDNPLYQPTTPPDYGAKGEQLSTNTTDSVSTASPPDYGAKEEQPSTNTTECISMATPPTEQP